ncbi:MAG: cytochrome c3 family protein [bacterium]
MAQVFPESSNRAAVALAVGGLVAATLAIGVVWYYFSPRYTDVGFAPKQPVPYSHRLHVGTLGLDCKYCHASVERSAVANVPPTQVCMNCHSLVKRDSALLAPIRASYATGQPMQWVRVHNLPDFAFFHHAVHVRAGVGCVECHGRIDEMDVVTQAEPLSMSWCLDCHRDPAPHLRPTEQVTNMRWQAPADQRRAGERIIAEKHLAPPLDCSGCHR